MKSIHQIDEVLVEQKLKQNGGYSYLIYSPEDDIVICPWCYNQTVYSFSMPNRCPVCSREITDADLLNSYQD